MKKLFTILLSLWMAGPAMAQWQVPSHAVPVGRGPGVTGFNSAAPGTAGNVLTSNGASADPTFQIVSIPASVFNAACTLAPTVCATFFGYVNPVWLGADSTATTDSAPAINAAALISSNIFLPRGSYKLASCTNNAAIDFSVSAIRDHVVTFSGVNGTAALSGDGTRLILDASIPSTCSAIRRAGTGQVDGTTFKDLTIEPSTGYYGAGVGNHCIFIDGTGQPDYFEYNLKIDNVFCGNMAAGQSFKTFASPDVSVTANVTTTNMTITGASANTIFVNSLVSGLSAGTKVVSQTSGTTGGNGVYVINNSQSFSGTVTVRGNNGGGAVNNSLIMRSILMSVNMKNVGDSITFFHDTVGQQELRGDPGYRWDQVAGAAAIRVQGGLVGNINGMFIIDGGTSFELSGRVELEQGNVANSDGCLIDVTGATSKVSGGLINGLSISQNSSIGTIYSICIRNADGVKAVNNDIRTTTANPNHALNTIASSNFDFNGNHCWTNGVVADCSAVNASSTINSQKVNIAFNNGTDPLNVGGFITASGLHMLNSDNIFTLLPSPSGSGTFRFGPATSIDGASSGGPGQVFQQASAGGAMTMGTVAITINGVTCTTGSSCAPTAAASGVVVGTTIVTGGSTATNDMFFNNAGVLGRVASANSSVLITSAGGVPSWATTLPAVSGVNLTALNATQLTSGTVPAARLPNPSASTLGGVQSAAAVTNQWINSISTAGVPALSQPAFSNISGQATVVQLPTLAANQLLGALTATTPSGQTVPSCSTAASALLWTSGVGFSCNTSVTANAPYFLAQLAADQTFTTTVFALLAMGTEVYDNKSWYDPATGKFTPLLAGKYDVTVMVTCTGTTVTACTAAIAKNGSGTIPGSGVLTGATSPQGNIVTMMIDMNGSTDFLQAGAIVNCTGTCKVAQNNPSIGFAGSWFQAKYIAP